jgi:hypothetical protein
MGKHTIRARGIAISEIRAKKNRSIYTVLKSPVLVNIDKDMCSVAILIRLTNLYESITGVDHNPELYIKMLKPFFMVEYGMLRRKYTEEIHMFIEENLSPMKNKVEPLIAQILNLAVYIGKDEFNRILRNIKLGCGSIWSVKLNHIITKRMKIFFSDFLSNCVEFRRQMSLAFGESCNSIMQINPIYFDNRSVSYLINCISGEYDNDYQQIRLVAMQTLIFKLSQVLLRSTGQNRDDSYIRIFKNLFQLFFDKDIVQWLITGNEDFLRLDDQSPQELSDKILDLSAIIGRDKFVQTLKNIHSCKEIEDPEGKLDISDITDFIPCFVERHQKRLRTLHGLPIILSN